MFCITASHHALLQFWLDHAGPACEATSTRCDGTLHKSRRPGRKGILAKSTNLTFCCQKTDDSLRSTTFDLEEEVSICGRCRPSCHCHLRTSRSSNDLRGCHLTVRCGQGNLSLSLPRHSPFRCRLECYFAVISKFSG